jgi:hypothetical protein
MKTRPVLVAVSEALGDVAAEGVAAPENAKRRPSIRG